jgi:hypothetical protein
MDVIGVLLKTGEEIIAGMGNLENLASEYHVNPKDYLVVLEQPQKLVLVPTNMGMKPTFIPMLVSKPKAVLFLRATDIISLPFTPNPEAVKNYLTQVTGIQIAAPTGNGPLQVANH